MRHDRLAIPVVCFFGNRVTGPASDRAAGTARIAPDGQTSMQALLKAAGVEFIPENGNEVGVRLRKPQTGS